MVMPPTKEILIVWRFEDFVLRPDMAVVFNKRIERSLQEALFILKQPSPFFHAIALYRMAFS
jgi:hypothetical protein